MRLMFFALSLINLAQAAAADPKAMSSAAAKFQLRQIGIQISANQLVDHAAQGDLNTVNLLRLYPQMRAMELRSFGSMAMVP